MVSTQSLGDFSTSAKRGLMEQHFLRTKQTVKSLTVKATKDWARRPA